MFTLCTCYDDDTVCTTARHDETYRDDFPHGTVGLFLWKLIDYRSLAIEALFIRSRDTESVFLHVCDLIVVDATRCP